MKKNKGFTIIELIVVIAVIAILAAIVTVKVTQYINKSKDAFMKARLNQVYTFTQSFYQTNGSYMNFLADPEMDAINARLKKYSKEQYYSPVRGWLYDNEKFCLTVDLYDGSKWCIDYTGYRGPAGSVYCDIPTNIKCR